MSTFTKAAPGSTQKFGNELGTDEVVVDNQGTIWLFLPRADGWTYLAESTSVSWDVHRFPPEVYEPYTVLDATAAALVRRAVK